MAWLRSLPAAARVQRMLSITGATVHKINAIFIAFYYFSSFTGGRLLLEGNFVSLSLLSDGVFFRILY